MRRKQPISTDRKTCAQDMPKGRLRTAQAFGKSQVRTPFDSGKGTQLLHTTAFASFNATMNDIMPKHDMKSHTCRHTKPGATGGADKAHRRKVSLKTGNTSPVEEPSTIQSYCKSAKSAHEGTLFWSIRSFRGGRGFTWAPVGACSPSSFDDRLD